MGKFKMPTAQQFLKRKVMYGPKKDPVWVYIRREMIENAHKKPFNTKVADWLLFLKDLRYHYYCEALEEYKSLCRMTRPSWYMEFSKLQKDVLANLRDDIEKDFVTNRFISVKKALKTIGFITHIPHKILLAAIAESSLDPGLFLWYLYQKIHDDSPSVLQPSYSFDAKLLMSALVVVDLDQCIERLDKLITFEENPPVQPTLKKKPPYYDPDVKYAPYLEKARVPPCYSLYPDVLPQPKKPLPINNIVKLRSVESYERLVNSTDFLEKRAQQSRKQKPPPRKCKYRFWIAPIATGGNKKHLDKLRKQKMVRKRAKKRHLKYKPPYDNTQFVISSVAYPKEQPHYILSAVYYVPNGYTPLHGGIRRLGFEMVTIIAGMVLKPASKACDTNHCECRKRWTNMTTKYLKSSRCCCCHFYDYKNQSKENLRQTYFYPSTGYSSFLFDHAKITTVRFKYSEFIRDEVQSALHTDTSISRSTSPFRVRGLSKKELLKIFLADLADTPLIIPHLPQAFHLKNLQEWVRQKVYGNLTPVQHKNLMLQSQKEWVKLDHIEFRAKPNFVPFTLKELKNMNWGHREKIQKVADSLIDDFVLKTKDGMLEHTRLFWNSMKYYTYPNKTFVAIASRHGTLMDQFGSYRLQSASSKIPFTQEQLKHLNFSHRAQLQKLSLALIRDFEKRSDRLNMIEYTNLFWKTMKNEYFKALKQ